LDHRFQIRFIENDGCYPAPLQKREDLIRLQEPVQGHGYTDTVDDGEVRNTPPVTVFADDGDFLVRQSETQKCASQRFRIGTHLAVCSFDDLAVRLFSESKSGQITVQCDALT